MPTRAFCPFTDVNKSEKSNATAARERKDFTDSYADIAIDINTRRIVTVRRRFFILVDHQPCADVISEVTSSRKHMSRDAFARIRPSRKAVRPMIDRDDDEDEQRRDAFGRKRVDVIECLIESSSDDDSDPNQSRRTPNNILWLKFEEICHIRSVLAQTTLSTQHWHTDKSYWKIFEDQSCFRCGKQSNTSSFLPAFLSLSSSASSVCHICQQRICQTCSVSDFLLPLSTAIFPVNLQTLLQSSSSVVPVQNFTKKTKESNSQTKTVCYDCARVRERSPID